MKRIITTYSLFLITYHCISQTITTVAGNGALGYSGDGGLATAAEFDYPTGVALNKTNRLYVADDPNNRIRVININTWITQTAAGNGFGGFSGDGGQATAAELYYPTGVACDTAGNIFIADAGNNRVRLVDKSSGIITTIAGNGVASYYGDGGAATAAELNNPTGVTPDNAGNVYVADEYNMAIRKVNLSSGIIVTVAGTGVQGSGGDGGQATAANLYNPNGTALDASGNLYIADTYNDKVRIVNLSSGIINTFAGIGSYGFSGDGGPATSAEIWAPWEVSLDGFGNLFITDNNNNRIRVVKLSSGIINTFAGNGVGGFSGDGGPATAAELASPQGTVADASGNVYQADMANNRIRLIGGVSTGTGSVSVGVGEESVIAPNPFHNSTTIYFNTDNKHYIEVSDVTGRIIEQLQYTGTMYELENDCFSPGIYFIKLGDETGESEVKKIVVE